MENGSSPLKKYQRQPKLYIDLPSKGMWYSNKAVEKNEDLEVYSMTANDEISIKTPDALFSGNTIKTIIENCVPAIKDAWTVTSIDIDYILAAIRLASYGETVTLSKKCNSCQNEDTYGYPIQTILDHIGSSSTQWEVKIEDFIFRLRPLIYKEIVENNQANMQVSRQLRRVVTSIADDDPEQGKQVEKLYDELNERTKDVICKIIVEVTTPDGESESNPTFIRDFILNGDPIFYNEIQKLFIANNEKLKIPELDVECSECSEKSKLVPELDYSNFFSK